VNSVADKHCFAAAWTIIHFPVEFAGEHYVMHEIGMENICQTHKTTTFNVELDNAVLSPQ
jgi:hypothetical protein